MSHSHLHFWVASHYFINNINQLFLCLIYIYYYIWICLCFSLSYSSHLFCICYWKDGYIMVEKCQKVQFWFSNWMWISMENPTACTVQKLAIAAKILMRNLAGMHVGSCPHILFLQRGECPELVHMWEKLMYSLSPLFLFWNGGLFFGGGSSSCDLPCPAPSCNSFN